MQQKKSVKPICIMLTVLLCFSLCACSAPSMSYNTAVTVNDAINTAVRTVVTQQHEATLAALAVGTIPDTIVPFVRPDDEKHDGTVETDSPTASTSGGVDNNAAGNDIQSTFGSITPDAPLLDVMKSGKVETLDELYIEFGKNITEPQRIEADGIGYTFELTPYAREMYAVFSTVQTGQITYLLETSYTKVDEAWQLYEIRYDEYAYDGMGAAELYEKAQSLSEQKYAVPAAVYAYLAGNVLEPCGISIPQNAEISDGVSDIISRVNKKYDFPVKLILEDKTAKDFDRERAETAYIFGFMPVVTAEHGISVELRYFSETDCRELYETSLDEEQYKAFVEELGEKYTERKELTEAQQTRLQARLDTAQEDLTEESYPILYWLYNSFDGVADSFDYILMTAYNRIEAGPADDEADKAAESNTDEEDTVQFVYYSHSTEIEVKTALDAMREELEA